MDEETKKKIDELYEITKENNDLLHGIRRHARLMRLFTTLKWVVIVGAAFTGYYFLQPYIDATVKTYGVIMQDLQKIKEAGGKLPDLSNFLGK